MGNPWLVFSLGVAVAIFGGGCLYVFYKKAKSGFGPYNTSTLVIILTLTIAGLIGLVEGFDKATTGNIFMGVIGFAAGIFAGKNEAAAPEPQTDPNKA
ncbi:hypothetical protein ACK39A_08150 [Aeromonas veronii]|uniref:hypothetical protein n=1 Tax=Aeromonas veronii TaxID=654 RepID=UPI00366B678C